MKPIMNYRILSQKLHLQQASTSGSMAHRWRGPIGDLRYPYKLPDPKPELL